MNAPALSSGRAASVTRAAAIGLSAVAAASALAGAPTAGANAAPRNERVPLHLIQRFPLNPGTVPAAPSNPAAVTRATIPPVRAPGAGGSLPLTWLLPAAGACLLLGVWMARRRASPAQASRHSHLEGRAPAGSTSQRAWHARRRRRGRFIPSQESRSDPQEPAGLERHANLGVVAPEAQGDTAGTTAASARVDEPGEAINAFNLGVLLEQYGELAEAMAAYSRADERGHAAAACNLGVLLDDRGELADAEAAYRRADQRGDAAAAFNLGLLLENQGELNGAEAAYRRADQRGDGEPAKMARAALHDLGGRIQDSNAAQTAEPQTAGQVSTRQRAGRASRARQRTTRGATKSRVLAALADGKAKTAGEVASTIGLARWTVSATLSRLAKSGEVLKAERGYRLPASSETDGPGTAASELKRPPT